MTSPEWICLPPQRREYKTDCCAVLLCGVTFVFAERWDWVYKSLEVGGVTVHAFIPSRYELNGSERAADQRTQVEAVTVCKLENMPC